MRYGHFDDAAKEYVIVTPATPLPWINYLGNEDFFSLISNTGGGYSFYKAPSCAASPATATTTCRVKNVPISNASMRRFAVISLSNLLLIGTQLWCSIPHASLLSGASALHCNTLSAYSNPYRHTEMATESPAFHVIFVVFNETFAMTACQ